VTARGVFGDILRLAKSNWYLFCRDKGQKGSQETGYKKRQDEIGKIQDLRKGNKGQKGSQETR
jgi:hypothetical protein